jgi:hypothetical protein
VHPAGSRLHFRQYRALFFLLLALKGWAQEERKSAIASTPQRA